MYIPVDKHMCEIVTLDIFQKNKDSDLMSFSENCVIIDCHVTATSCFERV